MRLDEITSLPAGRDTDALVAVNVMGHQVKQVGTVYWEGSAPLAMYSRNIADAWLVVEKIKSDLEPVELLYFPDHKTWSCAFSDFSIAHAETAPLAICRAALLAVLD